jgi:hypothetical protein
MDTNERADQEMRRHCRLAPRGVQLMTETKPVGFVPGASAQGEAVPHRVGFNARLRFLGSLKRHTTCTQLTQRIGFIGDLKGCY